MSYPVNEAGHLMFGGMDTVELAREFGTPLYVMDEHRIREAMRMYRSSIEKYYDGRGLVCYASKAFCCKRIYRICAEEGIGADCVSMGELYTAMQAGLDAAKVCYHGNNKSAEELAYALDCGVGRIVVDSFGELDLLDTIAAEKKVRATILLRLSPGIDAHTHDFIRTGQIDSKFGFAIELGDAMEAVHHALSKQHLRLAGVHCHIGSQIFEQTPFVHAAEVMLGFMAQVWKETGYLLEELNLGGGYGIRYTEEDDPKPYPSYMEKVSGAIRACCESLKFPRPFILMEPGRSIVGEAGMTLYTVGNIKQIRGIRTYVSVDGGMTDNIRHALYGAKYDFTLADRPNVLKTDIVTIAGKCCESGDLLGKDVFLQPSAPGEVLACFSTGAYGYTMSSNYNRQCRPAVVMLHGGAAELAVRRETLEDLLRNDC